MDFKFSFAFKKKLLQLFITLDIISWILFDLFVQYYAEQIVRGNTNAKVGSEEFYNLKTGAINLFLGCSVLALLAQVTGLIGATTESVFLLSAYIFTLLTGTSLMLLLACGNSHFSWYWSCNALWCILLTTTAYVMLRDLQHNKTRAEIEKLSGELKV